MTIDLDTAPRLFELLQAEESRIMPRWTQTVVSTLRGRAGEAEVRAELGELYRALCAAVSVGDVTAIGSPAYDELRALLAELSTTRARQGFSPTETAISVFGLRDALLQTIVESGRSDADLVPSVSRLVDDLGLFTMETFVEARQSIIAAQAEQLMELSTPVVKLWHGVLAVPLVGTLDSARTQIVMEKLLQALVDTGSDHAIIDITGVPAVDTQVAQHLLKTVVAARLMGAECIVSGIRPQIAQTIVALGIEFGDIPTKASLADALLSVLNRSGFDVSGYVARGPES